MDLRVGLSRHAIRDDIIPGLFLRVFPSGARSFALDRMMRGRRRSDTLGGADTMTVPEARREARRLIADTATGDGGATRGCLRQWVPRPRGRHWKPRTREHGAGSSTGTSCPLSPT